MKALMLTEYNHFEYTDVPEPELGPAEVLVQVKACGICGSDIHGMDGSSGRRIPPLIMGHEAAGVVARVGHRVSGWQVGNRVTFDSTIYCGACYFCRRGQINLCDHRRVLGVSCDEYRQHGAMAEYVAVPQRILYRLPDEVSFAHGAMVEPVSIAVHAVSRVPVSLDDTAVVVGAGMIGLLVIQVLKIAGCGRVIAVDLDIHRLQLARQLGADEALRPDRDDVIGEVRRLTGGLGADLAFEVVGLASTVKLAVQSLKKGGVLALVGNLLPQVELPLQTVVTRQLTLVGSAASCGQYPACLNMMGRGSLNLNAIISAVAPLREGAAWFERLYRREENLLKVILEPG
ncbi:MAG: galactitol-1-phosphate 5-dehydrogenase [Anaerolineae bacterium]|nr:galactitol-1-phosphate 5-dehydrogenase [Anaerolineae bacterium]